MGGGFGLLPGAIRSVGRDTKAINIYLYTVLCCAYV